MTRPEIQLPSEVIRKWQDIVDLLAEILHVPSALVMKVDPPNITVFVSSQSKGNPYEQDEVASLNMGLYCETVMKTRQPLLVADALLEEEWKSNPDTELGMISYWASRLRGPMDVYSGRSAFSITKGMNIANLVENSCSNSVKFCRRT